MVIFQRHMVNSTYLFLPQVVPPAPRPRGWQPSCVRGRTVREALGPVQTEPNHLPSATTLGMLYKSTLGIIIMPL